MGIFKRCRRKRLIEVDLENQLISSDGGKEFRFEVDKFRKKCLLEGLDDIALTLKKSKIIDEYESKVSKTKSWSTL